MSVIIDNTFCDSSSNRNERISVIASVATVAKDITPNNHPKVI